MSVHALGGNFKIKEIYLGRKIHKPSFDKIIPMFYQVAVTMFFVLSKYKNKYITSKIEVTKDEKQRIDSFLQKPEFAKIAILKKYAFQNLQVLASRNIQKYLGLGPEEVKMIQKSESLISQNEWVRILANVFKYISKHKITDRIATDIAIAISPFFFLRVLKYFEELNNIKSKKDINASIFRQAKELQRLTISKNAKDY